MPERPNHSRRMPISSPTGVGVDDDASRRSGEAAMERSRSWRPAKRGCRGARGSVTQGLLELQASLALSRQRLRDLARGFDEKLRHWAELPAHQGDDADRRARHRQLDRQLPDEGMPAWKLQPEFRNDGKIAAGLQEIGPDLQRRGGHGGTRVFEICGAKRLRDE